MGLFDRMNRVVRAELNYAKNQSISPEQEVENVTIMLSDAITKTRLAIAQTPPDQAGHLKATLSDLEAKLSNFTTQRKDLIHQMRMEARLQRIDRLCGNELSGLISLFEEIGNDIAAMKAQAQEYLVRQD